MKRLILAAAAMAFLAAACATSYVTPPSGVSIAAISEKDADIKEAFSREPAAQFPARIAIARIAQSGYNYGNRSGFGGGVYSVITDRDVESEASFNKIAGMSRVAAVAPLSRIFLSKDLKSTKELREAAAQLRADILLVYTIDSNFHTDTTQLGPLQTVALGMLSSKNSTVTSTCSFSFIDVRTGFVYGAGEATAEEAKRSNVWTTTEAVDKARRASETAAFDKAVDEAGKLWLAILTEHGKR